jgi:N-acetylneuraminic acid mutarotase/predicted phosphodiesterase
MSKSFWKRPASHLLALVLACIMMSAAFVGSLDSAYLLTSRNQERPISFEEAAEPFLEDMPLRQLTPLVYDSESDRIIIFGGSIENIEVEYSDTWSYDYNTNTWEEMSPSTHPPASNSHMMAYHSGADSVVLFGGHTSGSGSDWMNHNQTWTYDYNTDTWTNMNPAVAPPSMCGGTMEYDSESNLIVLFGGWPDGGINSPPIRETWTYNLATNTWTNVTTGAEPSARSWPQMAYDSESDNIVFFGGFALGANLWEIYNDTWTYDANTNTWTEISTEGPNITGDLVYDSESDRMVFYGGCLDMSEFPEDLVAETWQYDTNTETWEKMVNNIEPPKRSRGEMAYDSESDKVILFSGIVWTGLPVDVVHDCWAYDLNNNMWNNVNWDWQEMTPSSSPGATEDPAMAYDVESDLVMMFGGDLIVDSEMWHGYNETWSYDYNTNTWTDMSPSAAPPVRSTTEMVYDVESDIIILFGGFAKLYEDPASRYYNDTWAYDVNTNTWTDMNPVVAPQARRGHCMTYDSKSDCFILFGGDNGTHHLNDTWMYEYNLNTWTKMSPVESPVNRSGSILVYDEESELSVLYGGYRGSPGMMTHFSDTWVYNSTSDTWTLRSIYWTEDQYEIGLRDMTAVYDSSVDRIIMFGGSRYHGIIVELFDETWSYDLNTNTWFEMNTPNNPSARYTSGLAFDSESNRTILYGGEAVGPSYLFNETWAYRYQINPPPPPLNLEVSDVGAALALTWEAPRAHPETPLTGYNVYRGTSSGVYTLLTELGDVLYYTDTTITPDIAYYYVVAAVTSVGVGDYSNEASGSILVGIPPDDEVFTFIAYGDTRASDETAVSELHRTVVNAYIQHDPELIIHTGDLVNHGGEAYQWPLFEASIGAVRQADIPFYCCVGNHEWYTDVYGVNDEDYSTYLDYVDFSDVVDTPGETELHYSFDMEGIHFIFLNTVEEWDEDNYTCPEDQMDWLMNDLTGNYEFIVVSFHNPMYSVRAERPDRWAQGESLVATFHDLFIQYGVDIVFNGHDHQYYRTVRDGIYYVVTGGGGAPLYEIETEDTVWQEGDVGFSDYHYCVCSINTTTNQLDVDVIKLDETVPDTFSLQLLAADLAPLIMTIVTVAGIAVFAVVMVLYIKKKR